MARSTDNPWLHRFACLTALATFALVGIGGLVTSHGAGMAVPDWPTTYGYNMFFFPISKWVGGVFYEHSHRLVASLVGLLTAILAVWLWVKESRRYMRWLGIVAFFSVVFQGVLGGMRVVLYKDEIGIFHAAFAQLFLSLICILALLTSRWWRRLDLLSPAADRPRFRMLLPGVTLLVLLQLVLGATMRHQHAGLAIPDFPLAYHHTWPPMDAASVASYNEARSEVVAMNPITAAQIGLQMAHRIVALLIFCAVIFLAVSARRNLDSRHPLSRGTLAWAIIVTLQAFLGALTIWSNKAADVATTHVVLGALCLVTGALLTTAAFRALIPIRVAAARGTVSSPDLLPGKPSATGAK